MRDSLAAAASASGTLLGIGLAILAIVPTGLQLLESRSDDLGSRVTLRRVRVPLAVVVIATVAAAFGTGFGLLGLQYNVKWFRPAAVWCTIGALGAMVTASTWMAREFARTLAWRS